MRLDGGGRDDRWLQIDERGTHLAPLEAFFIMIDMAGDVDGPLLSRVHIVFARHKPTLASSFMKWNLKL